LPLEKNSCPFARVFPNWTQCLPSKHLADCITLKIDKSNLTQVNVDLGEVPYSVRLKSWIIDRFGAQMPR
jgi:hypothetical protein